MREEGRAGQLMCGLLLGTFSLMRFLFFLPTSVQNYPRQWLHTGRLQAVQTSGVQQHHTVHGGHPQSHAKLGH